MCQWVKVWVAVTTVRAVTHAFASLDSGASCKKETAKFHCWLHCSAAVRLLCICSETSLHSVVKNSWNTLLFFLCFSSLLFSLSSLSSWLLLFFLPSFRLLWFSLFPLFFLLFPFFRFPPFPLSLCSLLFPSFLYSFVLFSLSFFVSPLCLLFFFETNWRKKVTANM